MTVKARVICIFCGHSNEGCPTCQPEAFKEIVIAEASFFESEEGTCHIVKAMIDGEEWEDV
jgi:hypothetical protein